MTPRQLTMAALRRGVPVKERICWAAPRARMRIIGLTMMMMCGCRGDVFVGGINAEGKDDEVKVWYSVPGNLGFCGWILGRWFLWLVTG